MPIVLCRIDDRLIHGQVVVGWGQPLRVRHIVLVDDAVAASPWEQDLYRLAVPPEIAVTFADVATARGALAGWAADPRVTVLLTGDVASMAALHAAAPAVVHQVNVGGLHARDGRRQRLPYVFLSDGEAAALAALEAAGAAVSAQDVPTTAPVALAHLRC